MSNTPLTKEQEIELAYEQLRKQEKAERDAAWEQAEAEQNKGKE